MSAAAPGSAWLASPRFDLAPAPAAALLAQELVNTKRPGLAPVDDLLERADSARVWLDAVLAERGGPHLPVGEADLPALRELRAVVEAAIDPDGTQPRALRGSVELIAHDREAVSADASGGSAAAWLEASILVDRLRSEVDGSRDRLKLCANPDCRVAFYDRSRNRSAVWHSVERCGNKLNLRKARARRGQPGTATTDPGSGS